MSESRGYYRTKGRRVCESRQTPDGDDMNFKGEARQTLTGGYFAHEKYLFSVIAVCEIINGSIRGTGDPLPVAELAKYSEWLSWRLNDGWDEYPCDRQKHYDHAVQQLMYEAIILALMQIEDCKRETVP